MTENNDDSFTSSKAEVFEALGHPTRIRILQALDGEPLAYSELKRAVGLDSNGLLTFHLGKMRDLVRLNAEGAYALTDEGREALRITQLSRNEHESRPPSTGAFRRRNSRIVVAALAIGLVLLLSISAIQYIQIQGLDSTLQSRTTVITTTVTVTTQGQPSASGQGLALSLALNTTQLRAGQSINITASIRNTLPTRNNVTVGSDWAIPALQDWKDSGQCPSYVSIQVFRGYYTQSNISSATPLQISAPDPMLGCTVFVSGYFAFEPSSDQAYFPWSLSHLSGVSVSYLDFKMGATAVAVGYYAGAGSFNSSEPSDGVTLLPFPTGVYTVAAGDEWGQISIVHFQMS